MTRADMVMHSFLFRHEPKKYDDNNNNNDNDETYNIN